MFFLQLGFDIHRKQYLATSIAGLIFIDYIIRIVHNKFTNFFLIKEKKYMTFRQLELFKSVCEHQSITKVSSLQFISTQSISKILKSLEKELDCTLFDRTPQGMVPNQIGLYFLEEATLMLDNKARAIDHISKLVSAKKETFKLHLAFGTLVALDYNLFSDFEEEYTKYDVQYKEYTDIPNY